MPLRAETNETRSILLTDEKDEVEEEDKEEAASWSCSPGTFPRYLTSVLDSSKLGMERETVALVLKHSRDVLKESLFASWEEELPIGNFSDR